jgi:hypothetical protein
MRPVRTSDPQATLAMRLMGGEQVTVYEDGTQEVVAPLGPDVGTVVTVRVQVVCKPCGTLLGQVHEWSHEGGTVTLYRGQGDPVDGDGGRQVAARFVLLSDPAEVRQPEPWCHQCAAHPTLTSDDLRAAVIKSRLTEHNRTPGRRGTVKLRVS